ncbi:hypothetical protein SKAU_G00333300 [Synaphobranchus kaupii]|uniref:Uncharacterized protein n=1 Tax=Synaphobranchus kaupii TaxID=118154 RepID=A0A9Q1IIT1_SYNKA|nr:hypothetical protein SKAU_G00333300 [Synaphobranchus kaupii]
MSCRANHTDRDNREALVAQPLKQKINMFQTMWRKQISLPPLLSASNCKNSVLLLSMDAGLLSPTPHHQGELCASVFLPLLLSPSVRRKRFSVVPTVPPQASRGRHSATECDPSSGGRGIATRLLIREQKTYSRALVHSAFSLIQDPFAQPK